MKTTFLLFLFSLSILSAQNASTGNATSNTNCGTGCTITLSGSGTINANQITGNPISLTGAGGLAVTVSGASQATLALTGGAANAFNATSMYVGPSVPTGGTSTFLCMSGIATTGVSTCVFQAGAGQSTTPVLSVLNNAGTHVLDVSSVGVVNSGGNPSSGPQYTGSANIASGFSVASNQLYYWISGGVVLNIATAQINMPSSVVQGWSQDTTSTGIKDTSISRLSAGIVQFGDGTADANGSWKAINGTLSGTMKSAIVALNSGSNQKKGSGTLASGTATVSNTSVTSTSTILLTDQGGGVLANLGALQVTSQTAGTGFTVTSSNVLDSSNFSYVIIE